MFACVTGHRPSKLGGYHNFNFDSLVKFAEDHITQLTKEHNITHWYIGMALGWDMACAQACVNLSIPYVACVPFAGYTDNWRSADEQLWMRLCRQAKSVIFTSDPGFTVTKLMIRNRYMVNRSKLVLALHDGSDGGTGKCVKHAHSVGKTVINVWSNYVKV